MASSPVRDNNASKHVAVKNTQLQSKLTNTVEVRADYSVWDTVANKYLVCGQDFDAKDLFRA